MILIDNTLPRAVEVVRSSVADLSEGRFHQTDTRHETELNQIRRPAWPTPYRSSLWRHFIRCVLAVEKLLAGSPGENLPAGLKSQI